MTTIPPLGHDMVHLLSRMKGCYGRMAQDSDACLHMVTVAHPGCASCATSIVQNDQRHRAQIPSTDIRSDGARCCENHVATSKVLFCALRQECQLPSASFSP